MEQPENAPVAPFFRKRKGAAKTNVRRKAEKDDNDAEPQKPAVVRTGRKADANPLVQGTGGGRKRARVEDHDSSSDSDLEAGVGVNYGDRRKGSQSPSPDPQKSSFKQPKEDSTNKNDGLYHGAANYGSQLPKGSSRYGPVKGPDNVRTITLVDYQPDVCKDYKETGFCGFGDTCKFLHDRGDYLHGWQMDNNYLSQPVAPSAPKEDSAEPEEELPFACLICRQPFTDPVETRCGHYFCSACAIKRYSKTPKCFACGAPTGGIFNSAKKIIDMQKEVDRAQDAEDGGAGEASAGFVDGRKGLGGVEGLGEPEV